MGFAFLICWKMRIVLTRSAATNWKRLHPILQWMLSVLLMKNNECLYSNFKLKLENLKPENFKLQTSNTNCSVLCILVCLLNKIICYNILFSERKQRQQRSAFYKDESPQKPSTLDPSSLLSSPAAEIQFSRPRSCFLGHAAQSWRRDLTHLLPSKHSFQHITDFP